MMHMAAPGVAAVMIQSVLMEANDRVDLLEALAVGLVWMMVIAGVLGIWKRRGVLVLWILAGALWIWIMSGLRFSAAPWYIDLSLGAPESFLTWSLFAFPLAAATAGFLCADAWDRRGLVPVAAAALAWTGLFAVAAWVASYASDVGGANPRHLGVVLWCFGSAWLLWPVMALVWGVRRSRAG
jgi:hypothetical protein